MKADRKALKKEVLAVLGKLLEENHYPKEFAIQILANSKKMPVKERLMALGLSNHDMKLFLQLVFEGINKARTRTSDKYYSMEEINKLFNLEAPK